MDKFGLSSFLRFCVRFERDLFQVILVHVMITQWFKMTLEGAWGRYVRFLLFQNYTPTVAAELQHNCSTLLALVKITFLRRYLNLVGQILLKLDNY